MFAMSNVKDEGCLRCGMFEYEMLAGFGIFIYKVSHSNKRKIIEKFIDGKV